MGGLLIFVTIFLAVDALSTMVNYKSVATETVFRYYLFYSPEIIQKLLPVACLLGTVLTLSTLNKSNELIALFASGLSLRRIAAPILFWVSVVSLVGFYLSDRMMPTMIKQKNYIFFNEIEKQPGKFSFVRTDRIWYRTKNSIFNIKTLNPEQFKAQGLTMYFFSESWDLLQMLTAQEVDLQGNQWKMKNGSVTIFSSETSFPLTSDFKEKQMNMGEDVSDLQSTGQTSDLLDQSELSRFIDKNKEAGLETTRYEVDYHSKFGFALAGLVMSLLGIPFSITRGRSSGVMVNLGMCLGLVFGYWILYSSALTLGTHGTLPPIVAAWAPNSLMAGLSFWFLRKT